MALAFPPSARLRKPREFQAVLSGGRRTSEQWLTAASRANTLEHARLGLAISARAVPRAVDRNRIKRQTRETFRLRRERLPALDIVLLARTGAGGADAAQLRTVLTRLWDKLGAAPAAR
ncbi:MAG TPA: ribonuclease P protein component [Verrucomicrobiae bacterium]|nr:ribonuclease P protein component [Verrucomicrobiae bacterium]